MRRKKSLFSRSSLSNPLLDCFLYSSIPKFISFTCLVWSCSGSNQKTVFLSHFPGWASGDESPRGIIRCISFISEYYDHSVTTTKLFVLKGKFFRPTHNDLNGHAIDSFLNSRLAFPPAVNNGNSRQTFIRKVGSNKVSRRKKIAREWVWKGCRNTLPAFSRNRETSNIESFPWIAAWCWLMHCGISSSITAMKFLCAALYRKQMWMLNSPTSIRNERKIFVSIRYGERVAVGEFCHIRDMLQLEFSIWFDIDVRENKF